MSRPCSPPALPQQCYGITIPGSSSYANISWTQPENMEICRVYSNLTCFFCFDFWNQSTLTQTCSFNDSCKVYIVNNLCEKGTGCLWLSIRSRCLQFIFHIYIYMYSFLQHIYIFDKTIFANLKGVCGNNKMGYRDNQNWISCSHGWETCLNKDIVIQAMSC